MLEWWKPSHPWINTSLQPEGTRIFYAALYWETCHLLMTSRALFPSAQHTLLHSLWILSSSHCRDVAVLKPIEKFPSTHGFQGRTVDIGICKVVFLTPCLYSRLPNAGVLTRCSGQKKKTFQKINGILPFKIFLKIPSLSVAAFTFYSRGSWVLIEVKMVLYRKNLGITYCHLEINLSNK